MRHQFIPFDRVPEGSTFKGGDSWWLKAFLMDERSGERFNAFPVDPFTTTIDATAGKLFDDATLVRLVTEELPLREEKIIPFPVPMRART